MNGKRAIKQNARNKPVKKSIRIIKGKAARQNAKKQGAK